MTKHAKRVSAIVLVLILLVGILPFAEIFSFAQNTTVSTTWGGGFEGGTLGETPAGWTLVATNTGGTPDSSKDYYKNYLVEYSDVAKKGTKSIKLFGKNGKTRGYVGLQSDAFNVKANTVYSLNFSLKLQNAAKNSSETARDVFLGLRPDFIQYDKNGNEIKRAHLTDYILKDFDWTDFNIAVKTEPETASIKLFFFFGGAWDKNENIALYIDEISCTTMPEDQLVNGDFETVSSSGSVYGWSLSSKNNDNTPATSNYVRNYSLSCVENGYNGKAAAVKRNGTGYVTLDSNIMKVEKNATYIFDYAVKIIDSEYDNFPGVNAYLVEYDENKKLVKKTSLHSRIRQDIDWTEYSFSLPISKSTSYFQIELFCGGFTDCYFTAYFDDVRVNKIIRTTSKDSINNGGFEEVYNNTLLDWEFQTRLPENSFESTFNGYNGTKGLLAKRKNATESGFSLFTSNKFEVTASQKYKLSYMARIARQEGAVYAVTYVFFYDANDNLIEKQRVSNYDHRTKGDEWMQAVGYYTAPKGAVKSKIQITVVGINFEFYFDDFKWAKQNDNLDVYGFEQTDSKGNLLGWTTTAPATTKIDKNVYSQGGQSLFMSQTSNTQHAFVYCDNLIPVSYATRYKFTIKVKSYNCDINSEGIRLNAKKYDKNGNFLGKVEGLRYTLNEDSTPSNWRELICGVYTAYDTAYVQLYLDIATGTTNFWVDDLEWKVYSLDDEFFDDFDSVNNDGAPDGWTQNVVSGKPTFTTENSTTNITAEKDDDIGFISARWDTASEYFYATFSTEYASTTRMRVTIKFYDIAYNEIVENRVEKILDSTNGASREADFEFYFESAMYAVIEIGNLEKGTIAVKGIDIVKNEEEASEEGGTWRGKWIWHKEDIYKCTNSTRYFRYHLNIPKEISEGVIQITADDTITVWINGKKLELDESATDWRSITFIEELENYFVVGENVVAIEVENFTSAAGLLFDGFVRGEDGERYDFYSTSQVLSNDKEIEGWTEKDFNDKNWGNCQEVGTVGIQPWDVLEFDYSYFVENKFEIIDYTVTEVANAGEEVQLTMTVIPENDITEKFDLKVHIWVRNSQNKVLTIIPKLISGTPMHEWKAGETYTVTYAFEMYDFIGSGKYALQLDTNQVLISNFEIMNNRLTKSIQVVNDSSKNKIEAGMKEVNGTQAFVINGDVYPAMMYTTNSGVKFNPGPSEEYMKQAGIPLTRLWLSIGTQDTSVFCWLDDGVYDWTALDEKVYKALSTMPDNYLIATINMDVPQWWRDKYPDELTKSDNPDKEGTVGGSYSSDKYIADATAANVEMVKHMMEQPYWNRFVGIVLSSGRTAEWLWYGNGPVTMGYDENSKINFRKFLKEKYGTDAALREAWNNKTVTFETATVPTPEERVGTSSTIFLDPKTQKAGIDFAEYMQVRVADALIDFAEVITDLIDDKLIIGAYYGYLNVAYHQNAISTLHTGVEKVLENENIDFFAAPYVYEGRYDGEGTAIMQMVDSVLAHGKMVVMENDNRLCSFVSLTANFYTRDNVGPTYTVSDSVSQLERNFAMQMANNIGCWYFNLAGKFYEREKFADIVEICRNEATVNLAREKNDIGDVCYILDEDMYENQSYDGFDYAYEFLYPILVEQRGEFAKCGLTVDQYLMSDLREGNIPDHKVYIMLSPVALNEDEREAIEDELKCDDKVIVWLYLAGASDDKTFSAENMSEVIGMDVKFDTTKRSLSAIVTDDTHWLTEGLKDKFFGNALNKQINTPTAIVTDKDATVLAGMYDNISLAGLSIKEHDDWTSIYSAVPHIPAEILRNIFKKYGVHTYSESTNDVIFHNSNYVGINCSFGGEKTIKLPGTYAVYDVYAGTTYSLSTDTIKITMNDNSTKLFRLTPENEHVVYVDILDSKAKSSEAGYNEVSPGDDFSTTIKAKKGYAITEIIIDGVKQEMRVDEYTIDLEDVSNSHYIKANFKKIGETDDPNAFPMWIIYVGAGVVVLAATAVVTLLILKKKKTPAEN